jgi:DNA (cytosine-5)-methyltransferase 1
MSHKYISVCSGVEAVTLATKPLGWNPIWFSEIDKFPSALLKHYYPNVPNLGDMKKINKDERFKESIGTINSLWGGTPCQSFSVAGLRKGMVDPRGNLALVYLGIANQIRPEWVVWENVSGVLSSNGGRDFGSFLGGLGELGYGIAYRVLDAQYFGVPQRRRRVFVVGHIGGDWRRSASVLFEQDSLFRDTKTRRKEREAVAGFTKGGFGSYSEGVGTLKATGGDIGGGSETLFVSNAEGDEGLPFLTVSNISKGVNNQTPLLYSIMPQNSGKDYKAKIANVTQPLMAGGPAGGNQGGDYILEPRIFRQNQRDEVRYTENNVAGAVGTDETGKQGNKLLEAGKVRRLTPLECERLQGFPDNYTKIPYEGKPAEKCPDTPRYKAIGNSMAVPVMAWIAKRIELVDSLYEELIE